MKLQNLDTSLPWAVATTIDDPYEKVIIPCLKESASYDKGVGFFRSEWVDLAKDGLPTFVANGGKMRLLTSIKVNEEEFQAFQLGQKAKTDQILRKQLIDDALNSANKNRKLWTLQYISWLISQNILEVKLLVHKESAIHMYHDKLSFFSDGTETVCLNGSMNDSDNSLQNEEVMTVFSTWRPGGKTSIDTLKNIFEYDWNGGPEKYIALDLPDIVRMKYSEIQSSTNPYSKTETSFIEETKKEKPKIRDYQGTAVQELENHNFRGILAMATGTGKTLTSLFAVQRLMVLHGNLIVCIVVPQTTLLAQWEENIGTFFSFPETVVCAFAKKDWISKLNSALFTFNSKDPLFILTTYKTLVDEDLQNRLSTTKKSLVYIFDECHKLGSPDEIRSFCPNQSAYRIGLSATPDRWLDQSGTEYIEGTIGGTVYEYPMEKAIDDKKLCHYKYHIVLCPLSDQETQDFSSDTLKINKYSSGSGKDGAEMNESLKRLLNHRAKIAKKCESKWSAFFNTFSSSQTKKGTIVYVFDQQVEQMKSDLRSQFPALAIQSITADTPADERKAILENFNNGSVDVLVAIQCLDEGVDIPNCSQEFILASSTNPREFIQRRGRVLRISKKNPNKIAEITDFVTIANDSSFYGNEIKQSVIKRELPRIAEFVRLSDNKDDINLISYLAKISGISLYSKEHPWTTEANEKEEEEEDAE